MKKRLTLKSLFPVCDPNDTQDEPSKTFFSRETDDFVQFLDLIRFPQRTALEYLLTNE